MKDHHPDNEYSIITLVIVGLIPVTFTALATYTIWKQRRECKRCEQMARERGSRSSSIELARLAPAVPAPGTEDVQEPVDHEAESNEAESSGRESASLDLVRPLPRCFLRNEGESDHA